MPNRVLKESICTSDNVDQLSAFQETMFYRLIVNCDDYGRMDARPKILSSKLYPLKDIRASQIEDALRALTSAELVTLYEVDGKPFLQMNTWERHQQVRAKRSRYPGPESGTIVNDSKCKQMISDASICPRNPIQSESNPNPNPDSTEASSAQIVAKLPLLDGSEFEITEERFTKDKEAYPAVDVKQEYLQMARWLESNPTRKKTRNGIGRFINSWLEREQNKGGYKVRQGGQEPKKVHAQDYTQRVYTAEELSEASKALLLEALNDG